MNDQDRPRVAVIGAGHRGRGWAALALSRGWPVALYDPESQLLQKAWNEVGDRIRRLTDLGRASFTFTYELTRGGEIAATGFTRHACVDRASMRPVRVPEWLTHL